MCLLAFCLLKTTAILKDYFTITRYVIYKICNQKYHLNNDLYIESLF